MTYPTGKLPINLSGSLQNPAFSPDGTALCFTRWRKSYNTGRADIFLYYFGSGALHQLNIPGETNVSQPGRCWTNQGIIFSSDAFGPDRACYWDGAAVHTLFKPPHEMTWEPSWGPDFYVAERHRGDDSPGQIIKVGLSNLDDIAELTPSAFDCRQPNVSNDGAKIVYQSLEDEEKDLWNIYLEFLADRRLGIVTQGTDVTFHPDGNSIVYSNNAGRLCTLDPSKGEVHVVPGITSHYSGAPSFSPDGKYIAFEGGPHGDDGGQPTSLYIVSAT